MSLGALQNEADLERWLQERLSQLAPATITGLPIFIAQPVTDPGKIAEEVIEGKHLVLETITAGQISAGTITGDRIAAGTIEGTNIVAATITGGLIAAATITSTNIAAGTIVAGNIAAHTITGEQIAAGTITAEAIEAESITTELLAAEAVTAAKIKAGTITATQIEAHTITSKEIAAGTIKAENLEAHTITAGQIAAEAITAKEILANTITSAQIASGTILGGNIAAGTVTASNMSIAKLSTLTADAGTLTAGTITGATVQTGAAGARVVLDSKGLRAFNAGEETILNFSTETGDLSIKGKLLEGSVVPASTVTGQLTNEQLKEIAAAKITGAITETQVGAEAINTPQLKASAVSTVKLAAEAITAEKIAAGTITATQIKGETITAAQIKAGTITTTQIATGTILAEDIAALTITGEKIAAGTIAASKLSVTELSAITANLGSITAGTLTGTTIQTASTNPKLILNTESFRLIDAEGNVPVKIDKQGLSVLGSTTEVIPATRKLQYLRTDSGKEIGSLGFVQFGEYKSATASNTGTLGISSPDSERSAGVFMSAGNSSGAIEKPQAQLFAQTSYLKVRGGTETIGNRRVVAGFTGVAGLEELTIIDDAGRSSWMQAAGALRTPKFSRGEATVEWAGGSIESKTVEVTHELGFAPKVVMLTPLYVLATRRMFPQLVSVSATKFAFNSACTDAVPAAGVKQTIQWLAIT